MNQLTKRIVRVLLLLAIGGIVAQAQAKKYTLQIQASEQQAPATALLQQLQAAGVDAYCLKTNVPGKGIYYRVRIGNYDNAASAQVAGEKLRQAQVIQAYFVTRYEGGSEAAASSSPAVAVAPERPADADRNARALAAEAVTKAVTAYNPTPAPSTKAVQLNDEAGWEIYLAGGGSFWSHQDASLSLNEILKVTPDPGLGTVGTTKFRVRQEFARGGRLVAGLVKNINERAGLEFSYTYGTNNFKLTAQENITLLGVTLAPSGYSRSLGMRSHIGGFNYRHSFVNNATARVYLTGGFNLTVFQPTNDGLDQLFQLGPSSASTFKQQPHFKTVVAPGVNFGGGVILKANDTVGFRFDVRDYMSFTRRVKGTAELQSGEKLELSLFGNAIHNLVPTFGVVFTPR